MNRGHCPKSLEQLFYEVSCRLKRETEKIGLNRVAKLQLNLSRGYETKGVNKIILLHKEHHPKDVSRFSLQRIYRETCGPLFKDFLG